MRRQSKYTGQHVLARIPDDLAAMGWEWVRSESNAVTRLATTWYKAVYARPFERGIDDERNVVHHNGQLWIRVSTNQNHSVSWDAAHQEAIVLMREADSRRSPSDV